MQANARWVHQAMSTCGGRSTHGLNCWPCSHHDCACKELQRLLRSMLQRATQDAHPRSVHDAALADTTDSKNLRDHGGLFDSFIRRNGEVSRQTLEGFEIGRSEEDLVLRHCWEKSASHSAFIFTSIKQAWKLNLSWFLSPPFKVAFSKWLIQPNP